MRILDPRFKYIPAVATDVAATWKRFGFSERANEARRERWQSHFAAAALPPNARGAVLALCTSVLAACADLPAPHAEPRPAGHSEVSSPVFIHEPASGGEVRGDLPISDLSYLREVDFAYRECLAIQVIGQRAAASFGSSLQGRGDACEGATGVRH